MLETLKSTPEEEIHKLLTNMTTEYSHINEYLLRQLISRFGKELPNSFMEALGDNLLDLLKKKGKD